MSLQGKEDPLFVAEIGLNYEGNFDLAYELIRQAKGAGADIAKFQFGWRSGPGEINPIDLARAKQLKRRCEEAGIELMASLFTPEALELAREIGMRRYKIASRTVVDQPGLCEKILADGKPTYVSLGMWDKPGFPFGPGQAGQFHYLFCRSKYPAYAEDLAGFPPSFDPDGYYGYSDHCHGIAACLLALSRGARLIEKHFTLDKSTVGVRDHVLSATPQEFQLLTSHGRELFRMARQIEQELVR